MENVANLNTVETSALDVANKESTTVGTQPRQVSVEKNMEKKGLKTRDLILIAVLLAAGAVLKLTVASFLSFAGMKPNFIIAMYCLAILLVKPKYYQSVIIGLLAGLICQIPMLNATPVVNIVSELVGAAVCGALLYLPLDKAKINVTPFVYTFIATVFSGYTFAIIVGMINGIDLGAIFITYAVMVFGTALFNAILVQILYPVMARVLKR